MGSDKKLNQSISTWLCYCLDQFSHTVTEYIDFVNFFFFIFHWICLPSILLILVGVELPLCVVVTLPRMLCYVKLSMGSFVLFKGIR